MSELPKLNVKLLRKVQKHILADARRLDMEHWTCEVDKDLEGAPPCGTVTCIGGWIDMLTVGKKQRNYQLTMDAVGITDLEAQGLFFQWKDFKGKRGAREVSNKINLLIRDRKKFVDKWVTNFTG